MDRGKTIIAILLITGLMLAIIPGSGKRQFCVTPSRLLSELNGDRFISPDQLAKMIVNNDSTIRLIDLRRAADYKRFSIPGSVNIPYEQFLSSNPASLFSNQSIKYVLYSEENIKSGYALVLSLGMNFRNVYVLNGGLNAWFSDVMNSSFTGERISVNENALFEVRYRARKLFMEVNSLPDNLRGKYIASGKLKAKKLDGGCE